MIGPGFSFNLLKGNKYLVSVCMFLIHYYLKPNIEHLDFNPLMWSEHNPDGLSVKNYEMGGLIYKCQKSDLLQN